MRKLWYSLIIDNGIAKGGNDERLRAGQEHDHGRIQGVLFWLYNKGWFDRSNGVDGESWFYACYPEQEEVYLDMKNM